MQAAYEPAWLQQTPIDPARWERLTGAIEHVMLQVSSLDLLLEEARLRHLRTALLGDDFGAHWAHSLQQVCRPVLLLPFLHVVACCTARSGLPASNGSSQGHPPGRSFWPCLQAYILIPVACCELANAIRVQPRSPEVRLHGWSVHPTCLHQGLMEKDERYRCWVCPGAA